MSSYTQQLPNAPENSFVQKEEATLDSMQNSIIFQKLIAPALGDVNYGDSIKTLVDNINDNFSKIVESEFLRGPEGKSISVIEYNVTDDPDNNGKTIATNILEAITRSRGEEVTAGLSESSVTGNIMLIYEEIDGEYKVISSLPYVFIDERFKKLDGDPSKFEGIEDCSCIVQYSNGEFISVETFPTLYYDKSHANFCWKLNGVNTGLLARGPQGEKGLNGHMYLVEWAANTGTVNKYEVKGFDFDGLQENSLENVNSGDFAIVAKKNSNSEYVYYFGVLQKSSDKIYAYINGDPIYDQFTAANFRDFLKSVDLDNTTGIKGFFIPINNKSAHLICANKLSSINSGSNNDKLNMSITPVSDLDNAKTETMGVVRSVEIGFGNSDEGVDLSGESNIMVKFESRITSANTLYSNLLSGDVGTLNTLLRTITGDPSWEITEPTIGSYNNLNVYLFEDENKNVKVFSSRLNIYDSNDLYVQYKAAANDIHTFTRSTEIKFIKNETYIVDDTDSTPVTNTSLNFGYESVNMGLADADVNLNVKGEIMTGKLSATNASMNKLLVDEIESPTDRVKINKPILHDANVNGDLKYNGGLISSGGDMSIYPGSISSSDPITISSPATNIDGQLTVNSSTHLFGNLQTDGELHVAYGDVDFTIVDEKVENYTLPSKPPIERSYTKRLKDLCSDLSGTSKGPNSGSWTTKIEKISKTWKLTCNITEVNHNEIDFHMKPLVLSFKYKGRKITNADSCPVFSYGVSSCNVIYYQGNTQVYKSGYDNPAVWEKQIRHATKAYSYFSKEGTTYTDYVMFKVPVKTDLLNIQEGMRVNKVVVELTAYISGSNGPSGMQTVGGIWIGNLQSASSGDTAGLSHVTASRQSSTYSTNENNMWWNVRIPQQTKNGVKIVVGKNGLLIGSSDQKKATLKWSESEADSKYLLISGAKFV